VFARRESKTFKAENQTIASCKLTDSYFPHSRFAFKRQ
jgi:hypothetical protein